MPLAAWATASVIFSANAANSRSRVRSRRTRHRRGGRSCPAGAGSWSGHRRRRAAVGRRRRVRSDRLSNLKPSRSSMTTTKRLLLRWWLAISWLRHRHQHPAIRQAGERVTERGMLEQLALPPKLPLRLWSTTVHRPGTTSISQTGGSGPCARRRPRARRWPTRGARRRRHRPASDPTPAPSSTIGTHNQKPSEPPTTPAVAAAAAIIRRMRTGAGATCRRRPARLPRTPTSRPGRAIGVVSSNHGRD